MAASQPIIRLKQTKDLLASSLVEAGSHPLALTTEAKPLVSTTRINSDCVMWIHLQASICTEWEHSSMVVKSQPRKAASVREVSIVFEFTSTDSFLIFKEVKCNSNFTTLKL